MELSFSTAKLVDPATNKAHESLTTLKEDSRPKATNFLKTIVNIRTIAFLEANDIQLSLLEPPRTALQMRHIREVMEWS
jgi:hypothetical protein